MGETYTEWRAEVLEQLSTDLGLAHQAIVETFDDLEKTCEAKLAQWDGDARQAYTTAKTQWNKQQEEMNDILQKFQQAVTQIHEQYGNTEKQNASIFN